MQLVERADRVLMDEPCRLVIGGLAPGERVEVLVGSDYGRASGRSGVFESRAWMEADHEGRLDLASADPVAGGWQGDRSGHGPWWSADPAARPSEVDHGHDIPTWAHLSSEGGGPAALVVRWTRTRWGRGVTTAEVTGEGFRGRLWLAAPGTGVAGMVWLGGSGGGWPRGAGGSILASRGVDTIEVAYFGPDGLPGTLRRVPVEVAVGAAAALEQACSRRMRPVVLGVSRGSELALLAASHYPDCFAGAVGVVPAAAVHGALGSSGGVPGAAWTLREQPVPARTPIPVERIPGPLLLLSAGDDRLWPSPRYAAEAMALRTATHPNDRHLCFPDAGHTFFTVPGLPRIEPPAERPHPVTGRPMHLGGSRGANARAAQEAWKALLSFCYEAGHMP